MVNSLVSTSTPKQVTLVVGLTNLLRLMSGPSFQSKSCKVSNDVFAVDTVPNPMRSSI